MGANDSVRETEAQHVSLSEYKENITSIVNYLRTLNPQMAIILITPPPVDEMRLHQCLICNKRKLFVISVIILFRWPTRHDSQVSQYAEVIRQLSLELDCFVLDLWSSNKIEVRENPKFNRTKFLCAITLSHEIDQKLHVYFKYPG